MHDADLDHPDPAETLITYTPVPMQRQWEAARSALAGSPYERYLERDLVVPRQMALAVQHGAMDPAAATLPSVAGLQSLLTAQDGADAGYCLLDGPTLYVQSRIAFPRALPKMFEWWFWWHALDPRRYMLWFPHSHIAATAADPRRLADDSLSFAERFYHNRHHVREYMGPELFESVIHFVPPEALGFDPHQLLQAGFEASASGLLEMPGLPDVTVGMMVHMVRRTADGMELVSRYWLGSHPELRRFPGADQAEGIFAGAGMTPARFEAVAYELAVHDMTEWSRLARMLPALYAEFGPTTSAGS